MLERADKVLRQALSNPYVSGGALLFLVLYAGMAAPKLPVDIAQLFDYTFFKVAILASVLIVNKYNTAVALMVSIAFVLTLNTLSRYHTTQLGADIANGIYSGSPSNPVFPKFTPSVGVNWTDRSEERVPDESINSYDGQAYASFGKPNSLH